jgi:hypothetical protein
MLSEPPWPSVFVSYHHARDQRFYDQLRPLLAAACIPDCSLPAPVDGITPHVIMRQIREYYMSNAACTVVLCGPETHQRMYIDWEIKAALDQGHGLVGIELPHHAWMRSRAVPDRLADNIESGYAVWVSWGALLTSPAPLREIIHRAVDRPRHLMQNRRPQLTGNGGGDCAEARRVSIPAADIAGAPA